MNCIICKEKLNGNRIKFCSNNCKQKYHYKNRNDYFYQTKRAYLRKLTFIEELGGSCNKCGYNKNIGALEFHHTDETQKKFSLDMRKLSNTKMEILKSEILKCELLCANCHREHHNPELTFEKVLEIIEYKKVIISPKKELECKKCNKKYPNVTGKIYCSKECREKDKNYPTKEFLIDALSKDKNKTKLSKLIGISPKVIRTILNS